MFIKVTKSGSRQYLQLVEAYRDSAGRPKQRTVMSLGRLDQSGETVQSLHDGLSRLLGVETVGNGTAQFDSSRSVGDLWVMQCLWEQLGLSTLRSRFQSSTRHQIDLEAILRILVFNRLADAESKLGVLRWVHTVSLPEMQLKTLTHQHLLRTMDALMEHQEVVEQVVADAVRPLVDTALSVVFYDMTTIRTEGLSEQSDDLRRYGMSKEGGIAKQCMLGLVQTAEGIPLHHEIFPGNTAEVSTLKASLQKVMARFPIERVVAVADRGLLSLHNLDELRAMTTPSGQPLEFILAVPGRRYAEFTELLQPVAACIAQSDASEIVTELPWDGLRLVVAHDVDRAKAQTEARDQTIAELEAQAAEWVAKLDHQDVGVRGRGRSLSDGGVRARFFHAVAEARLQRIIQVDLKSELFTYSINTSALDRARMMDGKLLLVSNVRDCTPHEIVSRYKSLADIERGFKVLKSDLAIGPVHHRLPDRIRAHALICFIALVLQRVMRLRLRAHPVTGIGSPERALWSLRRLQTHRVTLPGQKPVVGLSTLDAEHLALLESLAVKKPTLNTQYLNL